MENERRNEDGFYQEYEVGSAAQKVVIFCRMCRRNFPCRIPGNERARVKCLCGHDGRLAEFDVFESKERAKDFAVWYGRIMGAVREQLEGANFGARPGSDSGASSDLIDSVVDGAVDGTADYQQQAASLEAQLAAAEAGGDVLEVHEVLTEFIALTYKVRIQISTARKRCVELCRRDIDLVPEILRAGRERQSESGEFPRLAFSSFKHLAIILEEDGELAEALAVSRQAKDLGLRGYEERIDRLQRTIELAG